MCELDMVEADLPALVEGIGQKFETHQTLYWTGDFIFSEEPHVFQVRFYLESWATSWNDLFYFNFDGGYPNEQIFFYCESEKLSFNWTLEIEGHSTYETPLPCLLSNFILKFTD